MRVQVSEIPIKARPFLRWAGSKRQILATLAEYWQPSFERFVEPFCGSASLFSHLRPRSALLSDVNSELIGALKAVKMDPKGVARNLVQWPITEDSYYEVRALPPDSLDPITRAARLVYLNRLCFNGLYRTNLKGEFNVPWGGLRSGRMPSTSDLERYSQLLQRAELHCMDFEQAIAWATPQDFVYLDPPYRVTAKRVFREYMPSGFGPDDINRLRICLESLHSQRIAFVLSYAESPEALTLASGFSVQTVSVRRQIAGKETSRMPAKEVIISNISRL